MRGLNELGPSMTSAQPAKWTHPTLGDFSFNYAWSATISLPAFDVFCWDDSNGTYTLQFEVEDESHVPLDEDVEMLLAVVSRHEFLPKQIATALWDDFNDRGPGSPMWWRNSLAEVNEELPHPITCHDDVYQQLDLQEIRVVRLLGHDKRFVEFDFGASFEEEHGVGVLTDGKDILGLGYGWDVRPFKD